MKKATFSIPHSIIWLSSLFLSLLMAVLKVIERPFNTYETIIQSVVIFLFSLFVWYYNILIIPVYTSRDVARGFSVLRLIKSLVLGLVVMFLLVCLQQLLLPHIHFGASVLILEVRGVLINLTFYMFIHWLYQRYHNQRVSHPTGLDGSSEKFGGDEGEKSFLVFKNNRSVTVQTDEVVYVYRNYNATIIMTFGKESYPLTESLEHVQELLSPRQFYRLSGHYLINFSAIREVGHYSARKLLVRLAVPTPEELLVRKEKTTEFLEWIGNR